MPILWPSFVEMVILLKVFCQNLVLEIVVLVILLQIKNIL